MVKIVYATKLGDEAKEMMLQEAIPVLESELKKGRLLKDQTNPDKQYQITGDMLKSEKTILARAGVLKYLKESSVVGVFRPIAGG